MNFLNEKKSWLLESERKLAFVVASRIIDKPPLSIWMILVPIFFVYYFYRLQRYSSGRKEFVKHFLVSRERAINEALSAIQSERRPDSLKLCRMSSVPTQICQIKRDFPLWLFKILPDIHTERNLASSHT